MGLNMIQNNIKLSSSLIKNKRINILIVMAKRVNIIGCCAFCDREVGSDGRPINDIEPDELEENESIMSNASVESTLASSQSIGSQEEITERDSDLLVPILEICQKQLERDSNTETILEDNAEGVMNVLRAQKMAFEKCLDKGTATSKAQTKRPQH